MRPTSTVAIGPVTSAKSAMFLKLVSYDLFPLVSVLLVSNLSVEVTDPGAEVQLRVCGAGAACARPQLGCSTARAPLVLGVVVTLGCFAPLGGCNPECRSSTAFCLLPKTNRSFHARLS